jgi:hypothetical protein
MGQIANEEYVIRVFQHSLFLDFSVNDNKQAVNCEYVLKVLDAYNRMYAERTDYGYSGYATRQAADDIFVNYCADNGLQGFGIGEMDLLEGNNFNSALGDNRVRFPVPINCIANISFNYSREGVIDSTFMWIRIIASDGQTTVLLLAGDFQGLWPKYGNPGIGNNTITVALETDQIIEVGVSGQQALTTYGIVRDLKIKALLKTNEVFIKTPLRLSAKDGNITREFPVAGTSDYTYSFFAHNQNKTGGGTAGKLVRFSYVSPLGAETVLYEPASIPDEYGEVMTSGIKKLNAGGKLVLTVKKEGPQYGVVDCLTIKGTI